MASYTIYKNLEKPDVNELYNINVVNKNNDIIDSELHKLELKYQNQEDLQNHIRDKSNPHMVTKEQVGLGNADNTSDMDKPVSTTQQNALTSAISAHNASASSHSDIRLLVSELTTRWNALADSDDTTLDQLSEIVAYIKNNKDLIDGITANKISVSDIIDDLTTSSADKPLSANQGKVLRELITDLTAVVGNKVDKISGKDLSANDYTTEEKTKLAGIAAGADVNVQSDWNVTDAANDAFIKNKPIIPTNEELLEFIRENLDITPGQTAQVPFIYGYKILVKDFDVIFSGNNAISEIPLSDIQSDIIGENVINIFCIDLDLVNGVTIFPYIRNNKIKLYSISNMAANTARKTRVTVLLKDTSAAPTQKEPGLRAITKEFTISKSSTATSGFVICNVSDFGVNIKDVTDVYAYCTTLDYGVYYMMTPKGEIKGQYHTNNLTFSNYTFRVTLTVKDYSDIGSEIVTENVKMITKTVTVTFSNSATASCFNLSDLSLDISKEDVVGMSAVGLTTGRSYVPYITGENVRIIFTPNSAISVTDTVNISLFVKVPVVEQLPRFTKDLEVTLTKSVAHKLFDLDGSENCGGYTSDNFHYIDIMDMSGKGWDIYKMIRNNALHAFSYNYSGNIKLRITIE